MKYFLNVILVIFLSFFLHSCGEKRFEEKESPNERAVGAYNEADALLNNKKATYTEKVQLWERISAEISRNKSAIDSIEKGLRKENSLQEAQVRRESRSNLTKAEKKVKLAIGDTALWPKHLTEIKVSKEKAFQDSVKDLQALNQQVLATSDSTLSQNDSSATTNSLVLTAMTDSVLANTDSSLASNDADSLILDSITSDFADADSFEEPEEEPAQEESTTTEEEKEGFFDTVLFWIGKIGPWILGLIAFIVLALIFIPKIMAWKQRRNTRQAQLQAATTNQPPTRTFWQGARDEMRDFWTNKFKPFFTRGRARWVALGVILLLCTAGAIYHFTLTNILHAIFGEKIFDPEFLWMWGKRLIILSILILIGVILYLRRNRIRARIRLFKRWWRNNRARIGQLLGWIIPRALVLAVMIIGIIGGYWFFRGPRHQVVTQQERPVKQRPEQQATEKERDPVVTPVDSTQIKALEERIAKLEEEKAEALEEAKNSSKDRGKGGADSPKKGGSSGQQNRRGAPSPNKTLTTQVSPPKKGVSRDRRSNRSNQLEAHFLDGAKIN